MNPPHEYSVDSVSNIWTVKNDDKKN
jgi:hypothetical protein